MISEILKEKTRSLHDRVEEKFQSSKIFDKTYTLDLYRKLIYFNYHFLLNFENVVFNSFSAEIAEKLNLEKRRKLPLIELDLSSLNIPSSKIENLPKLKNEFEAIGFLYVMEGSTLGGNIIAKQLSKNPEFQDVSFNYFNCYGEETVFLWKNFKETIGLEVDTEQYPDVLTGAQNAFNYLLSLP